MRAPPRSARSYPSCCRLPCPGSSSPRSSAFSRRSTRRKARSSSARRTTSRCPCSFTRSSRAFSGLSPRCSACSSPCHRYCSSSLPSATCTANTSPRGWGACNDGRGRAARRQQGVQGHDRRRRSLAWNQGSRVRRSPRPLGLRKDDHAPEILLLDEPLSNLDAKLRVRMRDEIRRIQQELQITTVYVTHDQEEALTMADRIAVMNKGVLQQVGDALDIYDRPATAFVADFIGSSNLLSGTAIGASPDGDSIRWADRALSRGQRNHESADGPVTGCSSRVAQAHRRGPLHSRCALAIIGTACWCSDPSTGHAFARPRRLEAGR